MLTVTFLPEVLRIIISPAPTTTFTSVTNALLFVGVVGSARGENLRLDQVGDPPRSRVDVRDLRQDADRTADGQIRGAERPRDIGGAERREHGSRNPSRDSGGGNPQGIDLRKRRIILMLF